MITCFQSVYLERPCLILLQKQTRYKTGGFLQGLCENLCHTNVHEVYCFVIAWNWCLIFLNLILEVILLSWHSWSTEKSITCPPFILYLGSILLNVYFIQILAKFHSFSFIQQIKSQMKGRTPHRREGARTHTLTSITPWWMDVYCFFRSITRVMTMTVAMTIPPTIRPIIAPLLELTSSAKKTYHVRENRERKMLPKKKKENGRWHSTISW